MRYVIPIGFLFFIFIFLSLPIRWTEEEQEPTTVRKVVILYCNATTSEKQYTLPASAVLEINNYNVAVPELRVMDKHGTIKVLEYNVCDFVEVN